MTENFITNRATTSIPSPKQQRLVKIIIQFLGLCILFLLPEVLMSTTRHHDVGAWRFYIKSAIFITVFFLNYYVLIDRCLWRPHGFLRLFGCNLLIIILCMAIIWNVCTPPSTAKFCNAPVDNSWIRHFTMTLRDMIMLLLTIGLSVAMKMSDYWKRLRQQTQEIETLRQHDELVNLKHQLNPHFLFNTLNSIYALIAISPNRAQESMHVLSKMLRYVLYENSPSVPLDNELAFIDSYVQLMRLRIDKGMPINVHLSNDKPELRIAPLIFISPVENAFKHGNTGMHDAFIHIDISCSGGIVKAHFANRCATDSISGKDNGASGIGDTNLRRRLDLIYGKKASITTCVSDNVYTVDMLIDLSDECK